MLLHSMEVRDHGASFSGGERSWCSVIYDLLLE